MRNVPRKIGKWEIASVAAVVVYPDGETVTANCVLHGGVWVGTVSGCGVSGRSENGFTVYASGTDENGNAVSNYVLGKGDVVIYEADGELKPNEPFSYVHLLSGESATPHDGDMYPLSGNGYAVYQNGAAHALGASLAWNYSKWVCDPPMFADQFSYRVEREINPTSGNEEWALKYWTYAVAYNNAPIDATQLYFEREGYDDVTATREAFLVLGSQTDKPL